MGQSDKERDNTGKNKTRQNETEKSINKRRTRTFEGRRQIENAVNKRGRDETRKTTRTKRSDKERNTMRKRGREKGAGMRQRTGRRVKSL